MNLNSVNSVMSTYNMTSLWNGINGNAKVPLVTSLDTYVQNSYEQSKLSGTPEDQQLQNILHTLSSPTSNTSTVTNTFSDFQSSYVAILN